MSPRSARVNHFHCANCFTRLRMDLQYGTDPVTERAKADTLPRTESSPSSTASLRSSRDIEAACEPLRR
eukprot:3939161-Rhodomonas_salina.2